MAIKKPYVHVSELVECMYYLIKKINLSYI